MGERKGTNKYYPPDFDPKKHSSLDAYHGTHPLRERAKKIKEGILVIRFEMPYNIWCDGCENPIGMGVRYNAEKSKVGMYYTTPIYQFRMKCHLCNMYFVIKTDPAKHDYVILEGARRKEQRWDPKENEQIVTEDKDDVKKRALDPMYKLEHGITDQTSNKKSLPTLGALEDKQSIWKEDYLVNQALRASFRGEKKAIASVAAADNDLLKRSSLDIELVKESETDNHLASLLKYKVVKSFDERQIEERESIESRPILGSTSTSPTKNPVLKAVKTAAGLKRNSVFSSPKPSTITSAAASLGIVRKRKGSGTGTETANESEKCSRLQDDSVDSEDKTDCIVKTNNMDSVKVKEDAWNLQANGTEEMVTDSDQTIVTAGSKDTEQKSVKSNGEAACSTVSIEPSSSTQNNTAKHKESSGDGTKNMSGLGSLFANYDSSSSSGNDD